MAYRGAEVQRLRRLMAQRSARSAERAFVVEGAKLVREALAAGAEVEAVYVAAGTATAAADLARAAGVPVRVLDAGVVERVADAATPQAELAIVRMAETDLEAISDVTLAVVCIGVQDPGNLGTILRSAEASGAGAVVCCGGTVDVHNPKTVRASAGSLFHVPVMIARDPVPVLRRMSEWRVQRLATSADHGEDYCAVDLRGPTAFVVGNEARGLDPALGAAVDRWVRIPITGRAESLNVAMAATILCFEAARQRSS